ncbi:unnamed protein product [Paramecium sonneborni]|uniref:Transmembrane protein n=1 Tax=Paramecium sonneborni TaxID=65129 RepID=A0A8S1QVH1_9CILI|nr:unnamed protein product [Paramecium sonneborni]
MLHIKWLHFNLNITNNLNLLLIRLMISISKIILLMILEIVLYLHHNLWLQLLNGFMNIIMDQPISQLNQLSIVHNIMEMLYVSSIYDSKDSQGQKLFTQSGYLGLTCSCKFQKLHSLLLIYFQGIDHCGHPCMIQDTLFIQFSSDILMTKLNSKIFMKDVPILTFQILCKYQLYLFILFYFHSYELNQPTFMSYSSITYHLNYFNYFTQ